MEQDDEDFAGATADEDEKARETILSRRARFVAAALTSAGLAGAACSGSGDESRPEVCLGIAAGSGGSPILPQFDAGADGGAADAGADAADGSDGADAEPQVCLSVR